VRKAEGKKPLGKPRSSGWIILKYILERWDGMIWTGLISLKIRTSGGLF
jgi:hypothetical protein